MIERLKSLVDTYSWYFMKLAIIFITRNHKTAGGRNTEIVLLYFLNLIPPYFWVRCSIDELFSNQYCDETFFIFSYGFLLSVNPFSFITSLISKAFFYIKPAGARYYEEIWRQPKGHGQTVSEIINKFGITNSPILTTELA